MPDRIGRYRVTGLLGTGASSTVLSAHDPDLDVDVAIKLLADHLSAREEVVQQFLGEARVLRDLTDPHVVGVHDVGVLDSGQPYLVMDLLDDGTLADRLRVLAEAGVSPVPADGLAVGLALADSVAALDQLGLVHGDIKPENIFLRRDPSAAPPGTGGAVPSGVLGPGVGLVLGDFGLVGEQGEVASGAGSAGYAAPEQERGAAVDVRSDLYSAAAVVHRVVRGMPPKGPIMEPVPVSGPQRTGLDRFFGEALAFDPSARPPSPEIWRDRLRADVVAELSGTFAASSAERRRSGGSSRRGVAVAVLCLILGVLVVASVVVAATKGSGGGVPELVAVGGGPSAGEAVGLSPDGRVSSLASAQRADEVTTASSGAVSGVQPQGVARLRDGSTVVARPDAHVVVRIEDDGSTETFAGTGQAGASTDGVVATSSPLQQPTGLAAAGGSPVYISDPVAHVILQVSPSGVISRFAGTGSAGSEGDGGPATQAQLTEPVGMAVADDGSVYVADKGANKVRKIDPSGTISTVFGTGDRGAGSDQLSGPVAVAVAQDGSVVIADAGNGRLVTVKDGTSSSKSEAGAVALTRSGSKVLVLHGRSGSYELRTVGA